MRQSAKPDSARAVCRDAEILSHLYEAGTLLAAREQEGGPPGLADAARQLHLDAMQRLGAAARAEFFARIQRAQQESAASAPLVAAQERP